VRFDPGVQIPDAAAGLGDDFALDLQDQAQHPVRRGVLGSHVDHDAVSRGGLGRGGHDVVPVLAADHDNGLGGVLPGHQL